jgi:hypothetical protein
MAMQKHGDDLPGASGSRKSRVASVQIGVDLWVIDALGQLAPDIPFWCWPIPSLMTQSRGKTA